MGHDSHAVGKPLVQSLYEEHHAWLKAWMHRRLDCPHQAADLTQDTFVRLLLVPAPSELLEPRAFLTTLAKRVLFSHWRRRDLERAWLDALSAQPAHVALSAEDYAVVREAIEAIDRLLDGLPLRAKQAFLLNRLEGLTHAAIAAELGVSVATIERDVRQVYLHLLSHADAEAA